MEQLRLSVEPFRGREHLPPCRCTIDLERCTAQRAPRSGAKALMRLVGGSRLSGISKVVNFVLKKVAEPLQTHYKNDNSLLKRPLAHYTPLRSWHYYTCGDQAISYRAIDPGSVLLNP